MGTVRVAAFADLHLGRRKAPGVAWAREALVDATDNGADVIVFTGDLLDKKKASGRDLADGIDLFRLVTEELRRPLVHVWGNHDVGSGMIPQFPEIEGVYRPTGDEIAEIRVPDVPLVFHAVNVTQDPDPPLRRLPHGARPLPRRAARGTMDRLDRHGPGPRAGGRPNRPLTGVKCGTLVTGVKKVIWRGVDKHPRHRHRSPAVTTAAPAPPAATRRRGTTHQLPLMRF